MDLFPCDPRARTSYARPPGANCLWREMYSSDKGKTQIHSGTQMRDYNWLRAPGKPGRGESNAR